MSNSQKRRQNQGSQWRADNPPQRSLAADPADARGAGDDEMSPEDRLQAEVLAEAKAADDGSVVVRLTTVDGEADIRVPRHGLWRSSARAALHASDDRYWAVLTLSRDDAAMWLGLDPTLDDVNAFFARWRQATGQDLGESRASRT